MKNIFIKTGFSQRKNEAEAVKEVLNKIWQENIRLIIFFADAGYNQFKINQEIKKGIPHEVPFIGCSSARIEIPFMKMCKMITSKGPKEGIVAMSIYSPKIKATVKIMKNIKDDWKKSSSQALNEASKDFNLNLQNINPQKYFGLFLCDAASGVEDYILENIYTVSNLLCVGGGSYGKFNIWRGLTNKIDPGRVHIKEGVFSDAGALALVECEIPFKIDLTTSFYPTFIKFKITKAKGREIYEFNNQPAAKVYAKALGVSKVSLGVANLPNSRLLMKHPLGLMVKKRAFIRSVMGRNGNSITVGSNVKEGQILYLMKRGDIVEKTKELMEELKKELNQINGMIVFQCGYRSLEADILGKTNKLFRAINAAPVIGLNAYGEYYGWLSMNQTLTLLAFGE